MSLSLSRVSSESMASSSFQDSPTCVDTSSEKCRFRATRFPFGTLGQQHPMLRIRHAMLAVDEARRIPSKAADFF